MARLTLAAGMPRSGSTWLYNALRLLLDSPDLVAGWIDDIADSDAESILIKLHEPSELAERADLIFTTHRPLAEIHASLARMGWPNGPATMQTIEAQRAFWAPRSSLDIDFADILDAPERTVARIAAVLGCDDAGVVEKLDGLKMPASGYDPVNLLHVGHRTAPDPTR